MASLSLAKLKSLKERHRHHLEHAKRGFRVAGDAMVVNAASMFNGYVQGRYGGYKVFGHIPFEVLLAGGFYGVSIFGPRSAAHQFQNLGHGSLAAYTTAVGRGFGRSQRAKAGDKPLLQGIEEGIAELEGTSDGGGALSTDDLIKMAERI